MLFNILLYFTLLWIFISNRLNATKNDIKSIRNIVGVSFIEIMSAAKMDIKIERIEIYILGSQV
ncbi:hypothetical protein KQI38_04410 [Tissierella carlieri]|uniref:hypothetical protein n=1 Tax=Tissierella carlieri TaxID=689904 RepID=UPI001C0F858C|nr:hypothetical protein [Tissierella carlieri]MBU5311258.1 hypothetical protein [Tissierella carlieri]MDU5081654.1 hypothetical protein [Bacillota bacterium]